MVVVVLPAAGVLVVEVRYLVQVSIDAGVSVQVFILGVLSGTGVRC